MGNHDHRLIRFIALRKRDDTMNLEVFAGSNCERLHVSHGLGIELTVSTSNARQLRGLHVHHQILAGIFGARHQQHRPVSGGSETRYFDQLTWKRRIEALVDSNFWVIAEIMSFQHVAVKLHTYNGVIGTRINDIFCSEIEPRMFEYGLGEFGLRKISHDAHSLSIGVLKQRDTLIVFSKSQELCVLIDLRLSEDV